jgi:glucose-1-phosphate thymidylyltransferase
MLNYLLDRLAESGIGSGILVTNSKFIEQFRRWAAAERLPIELQLLDDKTETNETRLGSIGDLHFALEQANVTDDFMVVNGDNLFTFSLQLLFDSFAQRGNTIALYDVGSTEVARKMGHATCDESGRVIEFIEKPAQPPSTLCSIGIYLFRSEVRALVDRYLAEGHSPDRTGDFIAWLHRQTAVYAQPIPPEAGVWFDIGSWEQYEEANRAFGGGPIAKPESSGSSGGT